MTASNLASQLRELDAYECNVGREKHSCCARLEGDVFAESATELLAQEERIEESIAVVKRLRALLEEQQYRALNAEQRLEAAEGLLRRSWPHIRLSGDLGPEVTAFLNLPAPGEKK